MRERYGNGAGNTVEDNSSYLLWSTNPQEMYTAPYMPALWRQYQTAQVLVV